VATKAKQVKLSSQLSKAQKVNQVLTVSLVFRAKTVQLESQVDMEKTVSLVKWESLAHLDEMVLMDQEDLLVNVARSARRELKESPFPDLMDKREKKDLQVYLVSKAAVVRKVNLSLSI
jgi:hypothetical protein